MPDHPVVHFEIGCHGGEDTRAFFAQLFGWEITGKDAGMIIDTGSVRGINGHIVELAREWGTYVTVYVEVEDLERYLQKADELGGKTLVPRSRSPVRGPLPGSPLRMATLSASGNRSDRNPPESAGAAFRV